MPQSVKDLGIRVSVIAKFVIDEDGNVTEISMYKGFNKEVDTEAMRVVGLLKKFTPGFLDGQSVKMKYFLPLTFSGNIK
jgi:outer membrane biosynthesis protein TonB